jgi:beta-glucosidase/6-phospho-beta-glucosidase/beta-galactosidase
MNNRVQKDKPKISKRVLAVCRLLPPQGIFLTGIENSDPVVQGSVRRDQLQEAYNFYDNYEQRLERIASLGIKWIRFGPRYSQVHTSRGHYDFNFTDKVMQKCRELGLVVVADLLHFGLPEWIHSDNPEFQYFQNGQFPIEFAAYAKEFTLQYPQVQYFTPVNEPFVTATFSTKYGMWNEQKRTDWHDDYSFVRAISNISRAAILAREEIEKVWKESHRPNMPLFIQNDSFEKAISHQGARQDEVSWFNLKRFAALDLIFGKQDRTMKKYLLSQGMNEEEYGWFMEHGSKKNSVLGIDHYPTCIHTYTAEKIVDHGPDAPSELYSLSVEYYRRYHIPLLHLEVNGWPDYATSLCLQTFDTLARLKKEGFPVVGMSWFGDEYQVGWHHGLVGPKSYEETPVGLFYKGELQPVGEMFKELLRVGL